MQNREYNENRIPQINKLKSIVRVFKCTTPEYIYFRLIYAIYYAHNYYNKLYYIISYYFKLLVKLFILEFVIIN